MNKTKIRRFQIISVILVFLLGTLLHFTYKLSGENRIVALFSAINESVWEHLKLVYFPMLITIIIGYFYLGKDVSNFVCSKTMGMLISMAFIVIFFYTYSGILGNNVAVVDILSFFVTVFLGEFISYAFMVNQFQCNQTIAIILLTILYLCFLGFTYHTPRMGIFQDPITGGYGMTSRSILKNQ